MKTVKKQVNLTLEEIEVKHNSGYFIEGDRDIEAYYTFSTRTPIPNCDTLSHFIKIDVPETIKEFLQVNEITKVELVEWLNKNYK